MKHKRFEENILVDEAYTNYSRADKNEDRKKGSGIAKNFAQTLEYDEKKKWFHQLPEEKTGSGKTLTQDKIEELRKEASSALHGDTLAYETKSNRTGSSDQQWARTLLNKGAIGDRVAAATILIQDNPIYNLTALTNLIGLVKPAKKKDGIVVIDALSELLISELLIPDARLRSFDQHPLGDVDEMSSGNKQTKRNILELWFYEDRLKELYAAYVEALNKFAHDSVEANKEKAVSAMSYLLMHHPEREKTLLSNIINKLGDPSQSVASKVIYHLCQLLYNHPNMKTVVLMEIEKMLFRTNISPRAQYYGLCFLNQFFLGKDDSSVAENLIRIYFSFFNAAIKKGDIESRLMSAILTGVKRAYPFADKSRVTSSTRHVDALYKLAQLARINVAVGALALLYHVSDVCGGAGNQADRFYTALYRKLTNTEIFNTSQSALLFSLVYKSLRQDTNVPRVTAFIKRLLQLCCYMTPAQACGMLFLISQVLKDAKKKDALKIVWTKKDIDEEVKDEKIVSDMTRNDPDGSTTELNDTSVTVGDDEVKKEDDKKIDMLVGDKKDLWIDDEEESYVDLKVDSEGHIRPKRRAPPPSAPGWFHARVSAGASEPDDGEKVKEAKIMLQRTINVEKAITGYDPYARNPTYSGAAYSAYLELRALAGHYHPAVRLFADKITHDQIIQYSGDPLKDFAGIRFLDRFVFKNPKKRSELEQEAEDGVKKVRGSHPKFAQRKNYVARGIRSVPINSSNYLNENVKNIPVDERFLYDFLQKRREVQGSDDEDDSDNDSVTSEDFNKYLDTVTGTRADESDEDLDFLTEMEAMKQQRKKKSKDDEQSDDEPLGSDDGEPDDDGEDFDEDIEDDDEGGLDIGDHDELMLEGSDEEEDQIEVPDKKGGKGKAGLKLKGSEDLGSLFASAEEFSTLLEDTASTSQQGLSQAVSNTDNSSIKQLAWEANRDKWIKGYNRKIHGAKKGKNKGGFDRKEVRKGGKRKGGGAPSGAAKKKKF